MDILADNFPFFERCKKPCRPDFDLISTWFLIFNSAHSWLPKFASHSPFLSISRLQFNPDRRVTVEEALALPYLEQLHCPEEKPKDRNIWKMRKRWRKYSEKRCEKMKKDGEKMWKDDRIQMNTLESWGSFYAINGRKGRRACSDLGEVHNVCTVHSWSWDVMSHGNSHMFAL